MYRGISEESTMSVRRWAFLSFIAVVSAHGPSKNVLDFLIYTTGQWDNKPQIEESGTEHDFIQFWMIPVDVPALRPNSVIVAKEVNNGVLRILNLAVVCDGPEKNSVVLKLYNFTNVTQVKSVKFDVRTLKDLTLKDLHTDEDSTAMFHILENGGMSGNYPYTSFYVNGRHPRFSVVYSCNTATATIPLGIDQKTTVGIHEYKFRNTGSRYRPINPPEDYESPCKQ